jgi:hypothetical protein
MTRRPRTVWPVAMWCWFVLAGNANHAIVRSFGPSTPDEDAPQLGET